MTTYDVPVETADNDDQLKALILKKFGERYRDVDISPWTYYLTDIILPEAKNRVIVFRAQDPAEKLGCVRVKKKENKNEKEWDVVDERGAHMGVISADCPTEAMYVEIKLVTPK